jgi:hypothetical protein
MTPTTYQCVNKIWYPPRSMCEQNMTPTTYQCVNKIWHPLLINGSHIDKWWVPYFIHTLIRGGCHILFTHWSWWVPYFVHTLISGGCHILFTHWCVVGAIFLCVNKIWHPPLINVWTKYGTHHLSICEQNMAPTTYQYVNKIWYPPHINVWTKYDTHHVSMCE